MHPQVRKMYEPPTLTNLGTEPPEGFPEQTSPMHRMRDGNGVPAEPEDEPEDE